MNRHGLLDRLGRGLRALGGVAFESVSLGVLSLAIAVVVWVIVTNSEDPPQPVDFPNIAVDALSVPANYVVSGKSVDRVTVRVDGPSRVVRKVRAEDVAVRVGLDGAEGDNPEQEQINVTRPLKVEVRGLKDSRVQVSADADEVKVTLERQRRREVRVQIKETGALPIGYEVESLAVDPPRAIVVGSPRNVASVEVVAADIKLDGQTVNVSPSVTLDPRGAAGNTIGGVKVEPERATVNLKLKQNLYPKQVAVVVSWRGRPKTGFQVTSIRSDPAFVTVVGPLDQINNLTGVPTDVIDIEGAADNVARPVRLQLPPGITTTRENLNVVASIGLQGQRAPGSIGIVPRVINVDRGLTPTLVTPIVAVSLSGPLAEMAQLRTTDVTVTVDAGGLGPGTHKLEPRVTPPATLQLDAVVPERVEVVLTRSGLTPAP